MSEIGMIEGGKDGTMTKYPLVWHYDEYRELFNAAQEVSVCTKTMSTIAPSFVQIL